MSSIRAKDTKPEIVVRKLMHAEGFRFRLHRKDLPGRPDLVLPKYRAAVFVHGCFWHGHKNCDLFRLPKSRTDFWQDKISANRARDERNRQRLQGAGWRVVEVWECAICKGRRLPIDDLATQLTNAIISEEKHVVIRSAM